MTRLRLAALIGLAGCAAGWPGEAELYGIHLELQTAVPPPPTWPTWPSPAEQMADPRLRSRLQQQIRRAAEYWSSPLETAEGWRLVLTSAIGIPCGSRPFAVGCAQADIRTVTVSLAGTPCLESSAFIHEWGHVALGGDPTHSDSRWIDAARKQQMWEAIKQQDLEPGDPCLAAETIPGWEPGWFWPDTREQAQ